MNEDHGTSSAMLHASGAMGESSNPRSSVGAGNGGSPSILPFGDKPIDTSLANIDSIFKFGNMDSDLLGSFNAGGGPLGGDAASAFGATFNQLGTKEVDETATLNMSHMNLQEIGQLHPMADLNVASTLSAKSAGAQQ